MFLEVLVIFIGQMHSLQRVNLGERVGRLVETLTLNFTFRIQNMRVLNLHSCRSMVLDSFYKFSLGVCFLISY